MSKGDELNLEDLESELEGLELEGEDEADVSLEGLEEATEKLEPAEKPQEDKKPQRKSQQRRSQSSKGAGSQKATQPSTSTPSPTPALIQAIDYRIAQVQAGAVAIAGGEPGRQAAVEQLVWVKNLLSLLQS